MGETLRHTLEILAEAAPEWLRGQIQPAWAERYGRRFDEMRLPKNPAARQELAEEIGWDGALLLDGLYASAAPLWLRAVPAVETLRRIWVQQYQRDANGGAHWRKEDNVPPAAVQINSPSKLTICACDTPSRCAISACVTPLLRWIKSANWRWADVS